MCWINQIFFIFDCPKLRLICSIFSTLDKNNADKLTLPWSCFSVIWYCLPNYSQWFIANLVRKNQITNYYALYLGPLSIFLKSVNILNVHQSPDYRKMKNLMAKQLTLFQYKLAVSAEVMTFDTWRRTNLEASKPEFTSKHPANWTPDPENHEATASFSPRISASLLQIKHINRISVVVCQNYFTFLTFVTILPLQIWRKKSSLSASKT